MATLCHQADPERHEIPDGARRLEVAFRVDWGDADLRESHEKPLVFCSFGCLSRWAGDKAGQHDNHVLVEGEAEHD